MPGDRHLLLSALNYAQGNGVKQATSAIVSGHATKYCESIIM